MILYSIILFLTAVPMTWISVSICRGKTHWIHDYHQTRVTDKAAYGRAFGKAMLVISLSLFGSGAVGLLGEAMAGIALAVLFVGLGVGIACLLAVQKKYNNGLF